MADMLDVKVGYDFGLLNRYTGDAEDYRIGTGMLNVGIAVNF